MAEGSFILKCCPHMQMSCCLSPQVEWQDANDPAKGFQYLYLTDADHAHITAKSQRPTLQVV